MDERILDQLFHELVDLRETQKSYRDLWLTLAYLVHYHGGEMSFKMSPDFDPRDYEITWFEDLSDLTWKVRVVKKK